MSQTPNLDAARASLQQAIDQANAIVKPVIDAMREAGVLTPAPEPVTAPSVDDDLLRDRLIAWLPEIRNDGVIYYPTDGNIDAVMENVVLPIVRERDDLALRLEGVGAHRERLLEDARTRDEGQLVEVARLRAAQQLPDVGPITRDGDVLLVGNVTFHDEVSDDWLRLNAARNLAVLARREQERTEADDTISDDEDVEPDAEFLFTENEQWAHKLSVGEWAAAIRALDAHRARGGQEAGQ